MIPWLVRSADHWLMTRINLMHPTQAAKGRASWHFLHYLCVVLISTRTSTYLKQIVVPASPASPRSPGWAQHAAARCSQACYYLRRTAETSFAKSHRTSRHWEMHQGHSASQCQWQHFQNKAFADHPVCWSVSRYHPSYWQLSTGPAAPMQWPTTSVSVSRRCVVLCSICKWWATWFGLSVLLISGEKIPYEMSWTSLNKDLQWHFVSSFRLLGPEALVMKKFRGVKCLRAFSQNWLVRSPSVKLWSSRIKKSLQCNVASVETCRHPFFGTHWTTPYDEIHLVAEISGI